MFYPKKAAEFVLLILRLCLGVCDEIARADACKMEHDVSDESFEKIKEHLKAKGEI